MTDIQERPAEADFDKLMASCSGPSRSRRLAEQRAGRHG